MNQIFQNQLRRYVLVFFDNILVYIPSWSSHLLHLESVLEILQLHKLFAPLSKCSFGMQEVDYLGHIVSGNGVAMEKSKVEGISNWPKPKNVKQLRGFLGLTGCYRKFIQGYAVIVGPLIDLVKKDSFLWNDIARNAFIKLKTTVT
uniref:Reverse transcriptase domain-containing protein n=1 Tax=Cajanus cajan TaxID=3821 RepID=A0A151SDC3_CAJCA|nr:hypothetical protein KK1_025355 [Cajanus cajan]